MTDPIYTNMIFHCKRNSTCSRVKSFDYLCGSDGFSSVTVMAFFFHNFKRHYLPNEHIVADYYNLEALCAGDNHIVTQTFRFSLNVFVVHR